MAFSLKRYGIALLALALALALSGQSALAESLSDPTRVPAAIADPVASGAAVAEQTTGLQSVIISKSRRTAIIDGETVELGGKHGDAKLIEVREGSVVLMGAQGRQVLTLFPAVKITRKDIQAKPKLHDRKAKASKHKTRPVARKEEK
ncbi:MAG TPA: hypothetical protein VFW59_11455 [Gallionella sp.]|nr:hypothetical protein [Gallionella sp.]